MEVLSLDCFVGIKFVRYFEGWVGLTSAHEQKSNAYNSL